jgi:cellulose synthase/poly-beta-1,6-N-acetylglucosamine synthase-like glycosyltransferase
MGVGRNLAYRRSMFFENNGYGAHNHLVSGDDDLFVNSNATKANTTVEFRKEAHTRSVPSSGIKEWIIQKKRHLTTAVYYRLRDQLVLIIEPAARVLFYTSLIILLSCGYNWVWVLAVFGLRILIQFTVYFLAQKKMNESGLIPYLLLFDIFSPLLNGILFLSSNGSKSGKNRWR